MNWYRSNFDYSKCQLSSSLYIHSIDHELVQAQVRLFILAYKFAQLLETFITNTFDEETNSVELMILKACQSHCCLLQVLDPVPFS